MVKKFTTSIILWYNIIVEKDMVINPFEEYIKQSDPNKKSRAYMWATAIGLQKVDGLKVSNYLLELARRNIEGEITIDEVQTLIESYYENYQDIENKNQDIETKNQDIGYKKLDIDIPKNAKLNRNTIENIKKLYDKYHNVAFFGRKQIMECIIIYPSNASSLIVKLLELNIIEKVKGHGKGKYRFR